MTADQMLALIGAELGDLRTARGWSPLETVHRLRASRGLVIAVGSLGHYESGDQAIPLDRLLDLCALYEVPVSVVLAAAHRRAGVEDRCPICRRPT